jgi:hypothetical protein
MWTTIRFQYFLDARATSLKLASIKCFLLTQRIMTPSQLQDKGKDIFVVADFGY